MDDRIMKISNHLFDAIPDKTLFHYTSMDALLNIAKTRSIWATDIRHFNDSKELATAEGLFRGRVYQKKQAAIDDPSLLEQLDQWLSRRITNGNLLFVASLTEKGNLLSQWRGYCEYGKALSLGFFPDHLIDCAKAQNFKIGRCIYEPAEQIDIANKTIDALVDFASGNGPLGSDKAPPNESYYRLFFKAEAELLSIAALLKHKAFKEEVEWRLVSSAVENPIETDIKFRSGNSALIPYVNFSLERNNSKNIGLERIYLGPTSNNNLSMDTLSLFLAKNGINPKNGLFSGMIPYRPN